MGGDISKSLKGEKQEIITGFHDGIGEVRKKLERLDYQRLMRNEDFLKLCKMLAEKETLLKSYLNTDFKRARELYDQAKISGELENEAERMKKKKKKKFLLLGISDSNNPSPLSICSEIEGKVEEELGKITEEDLISEEEEEVIEIHGEVGGKEDKQTFESALSDKNLRIKLIVSETAHNWFDKSIKQFISPFVNVLRHPPEFGIFHIALAVGPWKIEWNQSALCIPRQIQGQYAVLCHDIGSIRTKKKLDEVRNTLADVIIKWNTRMVYCQAGGEVASGRGNCQEFVEEVLYCLGMGDLKLSPPMQKYINRLRKKGMCEMMFFMDTEFQEKFFPIQKDENQGKKKSKKLKDKKLIFKTHEELDLFYHDLLKICPQFSIAFIHEFMLLKSFDRAFWMRWEKDREKLRKFNIQEKDKREILKCKPYFRTIRIKKEEFEGEDESNNEDVSSLSLEEIEEMDCPFGHPKRTTMVEWKLNRNI